MIRAAGAWSVELMVDGRYAVKDGRGVIVRVFYSNDAVREFFRDRSPEYECRDMQDTALWRAIRRI